MLFPDTGKWGIVYFSAIQYSGGMVDTVADLETQLTAVRAAIAKVLTGNQSYTMDNDTFNRPNLKTLYDQEKSLISRINNMTDGSSTLAHF